MWENAGWAEENGTTFCFRVRNLSLPTKCCMHLLRTQRQLHQLSCSRVSVLSARLESKHRLPSHTIIYSECTTAAAPVFFRTLQSGQVAHTSSRAPEVLLPPPPGARISRGRFLELCLAESALECVVIVDTYREWGGSAGRTACGYDGNIRVRTHKYLFS